MRSDPLARLPTRLRLWGAAALCLLPLGRSYVRGHAALAAQAPARVFLVSAAVIVVYAGSRVRTPATKRLVRAATGALGAAGARALADHAILPLVCVLLALALVAPLVWRSPRGGRAEAVFVPGAIHR